MTNLYRLRLPRLGWQSLDKASFGLIYGAITVLSVLMALDLHANDAFRAAIILFGSVLAMALARALASLLSQGVETGQPIMNVGAILSAWRGSQTILIVVNLPTALFVAASLGWLTVDTACYVSQVYCMVILAFLGARAGWNISGNLWHPLIGAVSAGGLGASLAAMKYALN